MRKKNSSSSNDYSRPTKENTTRNERQVSFDLRGSSRSIGLFEDVDVEDFEEREFGSHHQFKRDFDIGVRNQDIRNTRTFNAGCQELEPNVQIRRKMIARKQREHSDDEDDDDLRNNMEQSMRRNTYQTTEKNTQLGREKADESISRDRGTRNRLMEGNTNLKSWADSVPRTKARQLNSMEEETDSFSNRSENKSCYVKSPKFDGKSFIESHLVQFRIAASRNRWNESQKVDFLKMSLIGEANSILRDITDGITYAELETKLKQRYGSLDQVEAYRVQLKARRRKKNETLSELMMDIRRLFALAYQGPSNYMSDLVAKESFIDALDEKDLMIRVMEREPKSLEEAFKIAKRMELYSKHMDSTDKTENETRTKNRVRVTTVKDDSNIKLLMDNNKMLMENQKAMQHQMTSMMQLVQQQNKQSQQQFLENQKKEAVKSEFACKSSERPVINCFGCGAEGHTRSKCPEKSNRKFGFDARRDHKESYNKPLDKEERNEASSVRKIGQTLYAKMRIGGRMHNCLIDTGSEVNIIPNKCVEEQMTAPSSKVLEAANAQRLAC